ncbi:MAG: hypothetical protein MJ252_11280 [archaeon]|nr:hypothetical protein [archaeon]
MYDSKDIKDPQTYITDKSFNIKKDDLSIYNEKFFMDKEIEKRKKALEKERAEASAAGGPKK